MYSTPFGLQEEPFRLTSDPRFFYSNAVYQEAYASLVYGIEQRKGLVVLTGETGTGKTILLKVLMNHLEAQIRWIYIDQAIPTFEELLDFICGELQLSLTHAGQLQKIQALHDLLLKQCQQGGSTVLIIDEAQS
jgi:general secretion pathway protein A